MGIINMVYGSGGGGGGGGGYKSYTQLKAMTLADAITELNTDAQGYYNNLNGNGHIIGIGIANDDKTTYQCRGVSPIIYWNGAWRNGEIIIVEIKTDSNGDLKIPVAGHNRSYSSQNAPYNWKVSYDGGNETVYSGTGSTTSITIASGLTANTTHTIIIKPVIEDYGWALAFGLRNSGIQSLLQSIIYDGSYKGYGVSVTDTGDYFRGYQYYQCTNLTTASQEVLPNTVTSIGSDFRYNQYYGCTSLTTASQEVLPSSVTSIGSDFRYYQYNNCTSLTTASQEVLPSSVTSIGTYFRYSQYSQCTSLTTASQEVLPSSVISIGNYFRSYQYSGCTSLTTASQEVLPSSVTSIGTYFRYYQYTGCTSLTIASQEVLPNSITSIGNYFRSYQYNNCTSLTTAPQEVLPNSITSIGNYFRSNQYRSCKLLTTAPQEVLPKTVTSIGTYFRQYQYQGCTSLTTIEGWIDLSIGRSNYRANQFYNCNSNKTIKVLSDVGYAGQSNTLDNTYVSVVLVPSAYLSNFTGSTKQPRTSITDSKFVGY